MRAIICKIARDGAAHRVANFLRFGVERAQSGDDFIVEFRLVHAHQQMFVAALAHQVADALVHGHSRRRNAGGHGRDDGVKARRKHAVARAQNADHFIHVVAVGGKNRRAAELFGEAFARVRSSISMATSTGNTGRDLRYASTPSPSRRDIFRRRHRRPCRNDENRSCGSGFSCKRRWWSARSISRAKASPATKTD